MGGSDRIHLLAVGPTECPAIATVDDDGREVVPMRWDCIDLKPGEPWPIPREPPYAGAAVSPKGEVLFGDVRITWEPGQPHPKAARVVTALPCDGAILPYATPGQAAPPE